MRRRFGISSPLSSTARADADSARANCFRRGFEKGRETFFEFLLAFSGFVIGKIKEEMRKVIRAVFRLKHLWHS